MQQVLMMAEAVTATASATPRHYQSEADILDFFWPRALDGYDRSDLSFHIHRWAYLLDEVDRLVTAFARTTDARILDIGPSLQTDLLRANYPTVPVDTLDVRDTHKQLRDGERHLTFDLNELYYRERWPDLGPYDLIVMAEVIEHLYTGPDLVLSAIATWMKPDGRLFLQTPNAAALHKRLQLLVGRNPYMSISGPRLRPPHFHEYTVRELRDAGSAAGLVVERVTLSNYFDRGSLLAHVYNAVCKRLPPPLRAGISMTMRRGA